MKKYWKRRKKQYLMGTALIVSGILAVVLVGGDATIALITVPLGLYLVFTKEVLIGNDLQREMEESEEDE
ncbi:MAG: hypothetical protein HDR27_02770 [Lachnospiraceae bacterium]|nr:hypothetical protein [Lachnospiraceae bacterium]